MISAFISLRQARRVKELEINTQEYLGKLSSETQIALERQRSENEQAKRAFEIAIQESEPMEQALRGLWRVIQEVKDYISVMLIEGPQRRDNLEDLSSKVKSASLEFRKMYSSSGATLSPQAQAAAHEAKNQILSVEALIQIVVSKHSKRQQLFVEPKIITLLLHSREALTGCQGILGEDRADLRMRQLQQYLDLLVPARRQAPMIISNSQEDGHIKRLSE